MPSPIDSKYLLNDLLREVSRSFFLTLKFLPKNVRPQIGLAYLLARATDTVADTDLLPVEQRLTSLRELQSAIQGAASGRVNFDQFTGHQANPAERILLERINEALELLHSIDEDEPSRGTSPSPQPSPIRWEREKEKEADGTLQKLDSHQKTDPHHEPVPIGARTFLSANLANRQQLSHEPEPEPSPQPSPVRRERESEAPGGSGDQCAGMGLGDPHHEPEPNPHPSPLPSDGRGGRRGSVADGAEARMFGLGTCHVNASDKKLIQSVLEVITSGQVMDLIRFGGGTSATPASLKTDAELDDYAWRVAGCAGEFWTRICVSNLGAEGFRFPGSGRKISIGMAASENLEWLIEKGINYGKGLQYVNILRDIPADLKNGRCYIPSGPLEAAGLSPAQLSSPENWPRFQPLYQTYLQRAEKNLADGWQYTLALPRKWMRVRLACAWPILIGMQTLQKLKSSNVLNSAQRVKISRDEVRKILWKTVVLYPFSKRWEGLFEENRHG